MKNSQKTLTNVVLKTGAITLAIAFVAFSYGLSIFGFVFPSVMADFCDTLGAYNAAGMYYERVYNADKTPENLYIVLDRYIIAQNHSKVIKYAEEIIELPDNGYKNIVAKVNAAGRYAANTKFDLINWANEDNRIKSAYAAALLAKSKSEIAIDKLQEWLADNPELEQPNHAYFAFVAAGQGSGLAKQYFESYVERFDNAFDFDNYNGEKVFAVDFLYMAYAYLGDMAKATYFVGLLNGL